MAKFVIFGGGIAGVTTALELADVGHEVEIIERFSELLSGSSDNTACRLGLGFHYPDIPTAIKYLRATIDVLKKYPKYVIGHDLDPHHPYRRGRYYIVKDSLFGLDKVSELHTALREEYRKLYNEDAANRVLGDPDEFSKPLTISAFSSHVNADRVVAAFETAEQTLDWPKLKNHLIERVNAHPRIKVRRNTEVVSFTPGDRATDYARYQVQLRSKSSEAEEAEEKTIAAEQIINCAWENIEALNQTAGFPMDPNSRTNRTKVMLEIELPADYESKDDPSHPMFFCFGPYAAITPVGNRRAFITYEPVTNVKDNQGIEQKTMALHVSEFSKLLLTGKATPEQKEQFATKIIAGIAGYIPKLKDARMISVHFGNVRTEGEVKLDDPNSPHHKRSGDDIESKAIGLINFPSMKLLYGFAGGRKVKYMAKRHLAVTTEIKKAVTKSSATAHHALFASVVRQNLDRALDLPAQQVRFGISRPSRAEEVSHVITRKAAMMAELKNEKPLLKK